MQTRVEITDEASPWLEWAAKNFPGFTKSAVKSAGWWMSKEIKAGIRSGAPGGRAYTPKMPAKRRRMLEAGFGGRVKRSYPWLGQLRKAVGYQYVKGENAVIVGPLSPSAVRMFEKHEGGFSRSVSKRMRKAYFAAGVGMKTGTGRVSVPERPTIDPIYEKFGTRIPSYVEEKLWGYLTGNSARSRPKTRRTYSVFKTWF